VGRLDSFHILQDTYQDMKTVPNPLVPILRSRVQAEVLATVLLHPDREWTLTQLAELVGTSVSTVQREIERAEESGVVSTRRLGNSRLVRAETGGLLTGPLSDLLLRSVGAKQVITEVLGEVPGIQAAYLYGSWVARFFGSGGPVPRDIDLLVLGEPDRERLEGAITVAEHKLARPIGLTIRKPSWWHDGHDAFRRELTKRPILELFNHEGQGPTA
jgi:DNA-binding Lrp family transcriptional regulator